MDFSAVLPQFGSFIGVMAAFVVALSVIVAIHEYGHYIVGRWSGIKAEVFSLGFGPVLFSRVDKHGTRWQLAALPFGGYVKFLGDADAASGKDTDAMAATPPERLRQTMHGAPLWARTATVAAGPIFNFALSILIFAGVMMFQGKMAEPLEIGALKPLPAQGIELQPGDTVLDVAGADVPGYDDRGAFDAFSNALPDRDVMEYRVERDGIETTALGPHPLPPIVTQLAPQSAAFRAGMQAGDVITAVNGDAISSFTQLKNIVEASNGAPLALDVWREGETLELELTPRRTDEPRADGGFATVWRIGIAGGWSFEPGTERMGAVDATLAGVQQTYAVAANSLSGLYHMVTGAISSCNMSGPIGIAQASGAMASQGPENFIWFIAVLSTAVGLLNLFPVPVLDGGHLVFYAYEAVAGKPPSDGALRVMMTIGLTLILGLMVFALFNDIWCP
ncbi:RIP metalloprotease RseP [Roseovarius nanhaiticus]|uniref:Zinc metalloprotease n=1 Tax=Roseovarius nanhaiticus TaxID=573024 RepID=A0A1N7HHW5_9RHOB|nr:RIP metalloprotease RseP [Roseovarius nanhaiticus]SEK93274.1 regulator of sigma E protease [Roseovarius nanhaiticus]SIS24466.1 regulator of sigma E protease [Roseovarius nanhaiticus]